MTPPRPAALGFILVTVVLDVLSLGIVVPVLPLLVEDFVDGDTVRAAGIYGVFGTAWALMQFVFSPIQGALSDRFGRRPVLLASMAGLGADYVLMALAPSLPWLFLGRLISGMTAASFSTANAYLSDVTPPEQRGAAFGAVGAAFGLGFILGPAVGGLLGQTDPRLPFWVAAAVSFANAAYGVWVLPESLPPEARRPFLWSRANPTGSIRLLGASPGLAGLAAAHFLFMLAQNVYPAVLVLYCSYRYGWNERTVGLTLAAIGFCNVIVQGGLVRPVLARIGERAAVVAGLLFAALGYLGYGLAPTGGWMLASVAVAALGGFYSPAAQQLMTRRVDRSAQGSLQGALSSLLGVGSLLSPVLYTQSFARSIDGSLGFTAPGVPFFFAAALTAAASGIAWIAARLEPTNTHA